MKTYTAKLHNGTAGELTKETIMRFRTEGIINNYKEIVGSRGAVKLRDENGIPMYPFEASGYITGLTVVEEHG
jgi:hypothetical protein